VKDGQFIYTLTLLLTCISLRRICEIGVCYNLFLFFNKSHLASCHCAEMQQGLHGKVALLQYAGCPTIVVDLLRLGSIRPCFIF
jgi:hypothetical protein